MRYITLLLIIIGICCVTGCGPQFRAIYCRQYYEACMEVCWDKDNIQYECTIEEPYIAHCSCEEEL